MKLKKWINKLLAGVSLVIVPSVLAYISPPIQMSPIGIILFFVGLIYELLVFYLFFVEGDE